MNHANSGKRRGAMPGVQETNPADFFSRKIRLSLTIDDFFAIFAGRKLAD